MAVYKVPQDVEAEDKLIGPFSFRQFIYLLIAGGAGGLTFLFVNAPIPLPFFAAITVPVLVGFLILALPLRKDQPMEIYLIAILRFMFKPKRRLWVSDGSETMVVIDSPVTIQRQLSKDITQEEALDKLSYLSRIVDTRGWAAKGVDIPQATSIQPAVVNDAYSAEDVLSGDTGLAKSFDGLIAKQKEESRQEALEKMRELEKNRPPAPSQPAVAPSTTTVSAQIASSQQDDNNNDTDDAAKKLHFNPYPTMHQHVLTPLEEIRHKAAAIRPTQLPQRQPESQNKDMTPPISPDIMRLANNNDLSIQAIANEARRISEHEDEEVVIKLH